MTVRSDQGAEASLPQCLIACAIGLYDWAGPGIQKYGHFSLLLMQCIKQREPKFSQFFPDLDQKALYPAQ
jgi:hypothetical protein